MSGAPAAAPPPAPPPAALPLPLGPVRPLHGRFGDGRRRCCVDALALLAGLLLALAGPVPAPAVAVAAVLGCFGLFLLRGDYGQTQAPPLPAALWQAICVPATAGILHALLASAAVGDAAAAPVLRAWVATSGLLLVGRCLLHGVETRRRRAGTGLRRVLIVGSGVVGLRTADRLERAPELGFAPVGFLDSDPWRPHGHLPVLGGDTDLEAVVREHGIDSVIVGFSRASNEAMLATVRQCWQLGIEVLLVPRLFEVEGARTRVEHLGGLPIVRLAPQRLGGAALRAKYAIERAVAVVLAVLVAPVLLAVALAVRLTSGGPVLYRALRTGAGGRPFEMLKFRTMISSPEVRGEADSEWAGRMLLGLDAPPAADAANRMVYTPIGKFLRRTSLDELPQLLSVIRGDMTLIGPRPERVHYVERFEAAIPRYEDRHRIRPGMTGWAQVNGLRGETSLTDRIEWDMFYLENWSPWLDMRILGRTLQAVWRGTP